MYMTERQCDFLCLGSTKATQTTVMKVATIGTSCVATTNRKESRWRVGFPYSLVCNLSQSKKPRGWE